MIPYELVPELLFIKIPFLEDIYAITSPFAALVSFGIFCAIIRFAITAKKYSLSLVHISGLVSLLTIAGLVGSHIFSMALYFPDQFGQLTVWELFTFTGEISSIGGILSGLLAFTIYVRVFQPPINSKALIDLLTPSVILGFLWGRFGCALIHDHPGVFTDLPFAVAYPDGLRHDLGLYEFLFLLFFLYPLCLRLSKKQLREGELTAICVMFYGTVRFALDFLRARDATYLGLTPAQYGLSILMVLCLPSFLSYLRSLGLAPLVGGSGGGYRDPNELFPTEAKPQAPQLLRGPARLSQSKQRSTPAPVEHQ